MNCNRKKENESEGAWIDRGGRGEGRGYRKRERDERRIHGSMDPKRDGARSAERVSHLKTGNRGSPA